MVLPLRIPLLKLLVCANRLGKAFYIFLFLFLPIQNWGQELSFDEAINCLRNKDIIERIMLQKGIRLIEKSTDEYYAFPITITEKIKSQLIGYGYSFQPLGTIENHIAFEKDFSGYIKDRKQVVLNNFRDTIPTDFLQSIISSYFTFAQNYNNLDNTATDWYHYKKEHCVTLFGKNDYCISGMNTTLKIEIFEEEKFNDWSKIIDSKCKFDRTRTFNNESSYYYEFQDIYIELTNSTDESRYSIEFTLPTPR